MAANAFLSGFTGGMGAMSNVMNYTEQRQQRQQQLNDQQLQRNIASMMHIDNSFGDDNEKRQAYRTGLFDTLNENPAIKSALELEIPGVEAKVYGLEPTAQGFVPIIRYEQDGETITRPITLEGKNQPLAIGQEDLFRAIGLNPELLDKSTRLGAQLLGSGGSLPEKPETFTQETRNGMLFNRSSKSNELKPISGTGSKSGSGSGTKANPKVLLKRDEDGHQVQYTMEDGHVIRTVWPLADEEGNFRDPTRSDVTGQWNNIFQSGNVADRMLGGNQGMVGVPAAGEPLVVIPDTRPIHEIPGVGAKAEQEEADTESPEEEEKNPRTRPKRTPTTPNQLNTGYRPYQVPKEGRERASQAWGKVFDQAAEFAAKQKQVSQIGRQNIANARTNYGGMIGQQTAQSTPAAEPSQGQVEQAYKDVERIMEEGDENELIDYLTQLDESVIRKIQQLRIKEGKLVAKGGMQ